MSRATVLVVIYILACHEYRIKRLINMLHLKFFLMFHPISHFPSSSFKGAC
uniref:Uncharacterized protein n=1 Tax=Arundo donax TaxID=35708 RepID=A0A0A8Z154_ARUDO